jgi:hypothetical protein
MGSARPLEWRAVPPDGGLTFSAPRRINDDPINHNKWHWFGTLAVAPNGRIDSVWLAFARTRKPVRLIGIGVRFAERTPESSQMDLL